MNKIKQVLLKGLLSLHGQKKICDCLQEIDSAFDILLREHQKVWQENLNAESNIGLELYRRKLKKQKEEIKNIVKKIEKRKFPRGGRKWCVECAKRIRKDILEEIEKL